MNIVPSIPFILGMLYKILLMKKNSVLWKTVKAHLEQFFLLKKIQSFEGSQIPSYRKMAEGTGTKAVNKLFNKFQVKMKNVIFTLNQGTFWPTQSAGDIWT